MAARWRAWTLFVTAYWRINLAAVLEYRASFISQVLGMFINDGIWLAFWALFFARAKVVRGWDAQDIITLWAVITLAFGLHCALAGNALRLATLITRGQLDYYLALPKDPLVHMLISDVNLFGLGDALFGPVVYLLLTPVTWERTALFLISGLCGAVIFASFGVITGSLAFWLGNAETLARQAFEGMLNFSTYPDAIFNGAVKVVIYTVLPGAVVGSLPVRLMRQFDGRLLAAELGAAVLFALVAVSVFRLGLRRYESGNLLTMRGQ